MLTPIFEMDRVGCKMEECFRKGYSYVWENSCSRYMFKHKAWEPSWLDHQIKKHLITARNISSFIFGARGPRCNYRSSKKHLLWLWLQGVMSHHAKNSPPYKE